MLSSSSFLQFQNLPIFIIAQGKDSSFVVVCHAKELLFSERANIGVFVHHLRIWCV